MTVRKKIRRLKKVQTTIHINMSQNEKTVLTRTRVVEDETRVTKGREKDELFKSWSLRKEMEKYENQTVISYYQKDSSLLQEPVFFFFF